MTTATPAGLGDTADPLWDVPPRAHCRRCAPGGTGHFCPDCVKASHAEAFRPLIDYVLARRCPTCKAPVGTYCDVRASKGLITSAASRCHAPRIDRGLVHYHRDVVKAPWPEEREPGRCYSTLPGVTHSA